MRQIANKFSIQFTALYSSGAIWRLNIFTHIGEEKINTSEVKTQFLCKKMFQPLFGSVTNLVKFRIFKKCFWIPKYHALWYPSVKINLMISSKRGDMIILPQYCFWRI